MSYDDANQALMGGGGRSASFKQHGDQVWGEIVSYELRQQMDFDDGSPLVWDDGKPRMQVVISLQTDLREDEEDDGVRRVYVKIPSQMRQAMQKAVVKAGAKGIVEGGKFLVRYMSDGEPKKKGMSGQKQYFCKYEPPAYVLGQDDGFDDVPPPDDDSLPF